MKGEYWLAANHDETEWYVMRGVEVISGPHGDARTALESLELSPIEIQRLLCEVEP